VFESLLFSRLTSCLQPTHLAIRLNWASLRQSDEEHKERSVAKQERSFPSQQSPPTARPLRQTTRRSVKKAESVLAPEIVACLSEASLERVESKSDSEEDTCFGIVWEKITEPVRTIKETAVTKGIKLMSYREALECSRHGEVLRWSSDSEVETEKTDGTGKEKLSCPFEGLIVPETELQDSPEKAGKEATVIETFIGMKVAKQFEAGLFIGEITAVNSERGRCLYTVLYEGGDGEDMNDREFKEARELFEQPKGKSSKKTRD
jgi:hypothetical protein